MSQSTQYLDPALLAEIEVLAVEIARGCTEGCRFCQAGMIYRPVRERDPQQIVDRAIHARGPIRTAHICRSALRPSPSVFRW